MMKTLLILFFSTSLISLKAQTDEILLEKALYNLPDVSFKKVSAFGDKYLKYDLLIKQPLDHQHPEKGFFYQRVQLTHKGFNKPTVMDTEGYWLWNGGSGNEIENILDANNLDIEYRYYGKSLPDSIDWQYLTLEQATADLHHINELFKTVYTNKFISTGISKGGETTIYYKYFYPHDVDLAVPYVAPLDNSLEDKRIYHFFDTIGTPECRQKIKDFQTFLLQHEKEILPKLEWYSKGAGLHYTYTGSVGKSFEYAVLEFSFSFWQYNGNCDSVPSNKNVDDYINVLINNVGLLPFSDEGLKEFEAHYYQAQTESGYYGYNIEPFK
ncbi:MAG: S28 family serine protease, partial [Parafilimonas sp.]